MNVTRNIMATIFIILFFILGLVFYIFCEQIQEKEIIEKDCPNVLVKRGNSIILYNNKTNVTIPFSSLEQYFSYYQKQEKLGKKCPVLYLQQEHNVQNQPVYRMRPFGDVEHLADTSEAPIVITVKDSTNDGIYNKGFVSGFDRLEQTQGIYAIRSPNDTLDENGVSWDSANSAWGGEAYTQEKLDSGELSNEGVVRPQYTNLRSGENDETMLTNAPNYTTGTTTGTTFP